MYGTKARFGIMPTMDDAVLEPELYAMAPPDIAIYTSRLMKPNSDTNIDTQSSAFESIDRCVDELVWIRPSILCFGSTSASFVGGKEYDNNIIKRMEKRSGGIPSTTISTALINSLRILGSKKLSIVTPYVEELNIREKNFLEELGFEVISINGFNLLSSDDICGLKPNQIYEYALDNFDTKADTLVFSCTGLHTEPILQKIENELKRPTISSNTVALWEMLRKSKIEEKVKGHGKLLSDY
mgnify:CR=1 FL=1|jgi:maleate isomerase